MTTYRKRLVDELQRRQKRNSRYSLRAFARDIGVNPSVISDFLSAKRDLSPKNILRVGERLVFPREIISNTLRSCNSRKLPFEASSKHQSLLENQFEVIRDWHYFAILSLAQIPRAQAKAEWIAARLGITAVEAEKAINVLVRCGYLKIERGRLVRTALQFVVDPGTPSQVIRSFHRQHLEKAVHALDSIPMEFREFRTSIFAIDPKSLSKVRRELDRFRFKLERIVKTRRPKQVYALTMQFVPLSLFLEREKP